MGTEFFAQVLQLVFIGISLGCIYALVAVGFSVIFNATGIVNFAQGEFLMLAACRSEIARPNFSHFFGLPWGTKPMSLPRNMAEWGVSQQ